MQVERTILKSNRTDSEWRKGEEWIGNIPRAPE